MEAESNTSANSLESVSCPGCKERDKQYAELKEKYEKLEHQVNQLLRHRFGKRSEKKISLPKSSLSSSATKNVNGRKPLPEHLARETINYEIPQDNQICNHCHHALVKIGEEVSEQLDYIRPHLRVRKHIQCKYGCSHCGGTILLAEKPEQPIAKGLATANLLAHILISKYQDHLPLYRQEQIFARDGIDLVRSTLCDWVKESATLLEILVKVMRKDLLIRNRIHSDDTPVPVQVNEKKGKTHLGRLWVYLGHEENKPTIVIYDYTPTRNQSGPVNFLKGYIGFLQADAYAGYDKLYEDEKIIEVACWAHARRKFYEVAVATVSERANIALAFIGELYAIETEAKYFTVEARLALRASKSKPILEKFKVWLEEQERLLLKKSPLGNAIRYTLKLWDALNTYVHYGFLEIDNNRAERAMKVVVLGRKNWLFAGSHKGAKHAAIIYSLIETCKENKINTYEYLSDVLARLPSHPINRAHELLPYHWKPQAPPESAENTENILNAA